MRPARKNLRITILMLGLIGMFSGMLLAPSPAHGDYLVCYDTDLAFDSSHWSFGSNGYWVTTSPGVAGETDIGDGNGPYLSVVISWSGTKTVDHIDLQYYSNGGSRYYSIFTSGPSSSWGTGTVFNSGTPGSFATITATSSAINANYARIQVADTNGASQIKNVHICETLPGTPSPTPAGTNTPTPTPSPTPIPPVDPGGTLGKVCQLLGEANSTFTSLPGNWDLQPGAPIIAPPHNPPGSSQGLYLFLGRATLSLSLDPSVQYSIYVVYDVGTTDGLPDHFTMKLGSNPDIDVPIAATLSQQTFTAPPSIYNPYYVVYQDGIKSPGLYDFTISKQLNGGAIDSQLVIRYVCISAINTNPDGSAAVPTALIAQCSDCVYKPVGNLILDIPQLLLWLWCGISQLWDCVAKSLLAGIWKTIAGVLIFLSFVRVWFGLIVSHGADWLLGSVRVLWAWLGGNVTNLITSIINGAAYILKNLGIINFINAIVGFIDGIISAILSIPAGIISAINSLGTFFSAIAQTVGTALGIVGYWIGRTFDTVIGVIGFIPQVIISIITGFNATSTIPAWAPLCTDTNQLLYYPCLGMYILDNTIFDGPIYYLIPAAMGIIGTYTLLWTVQQVKLFMEQS